MFVITELDGVRIIGSDVCDFIQKVPGAHHGHLRELLSFTLVFSSVDPFDLQAWFYISLSDTL